jgi:hypothetical protein
MFFLKGNGKIKVLIKKTENNHQRFHHHHNQNLRLHRKRHHLPLIGRDRDGLILRNNKRT